jgi:hypothetical protein
MPRPCPRHGGVRRDKPRLRTGPIYWAADSCQAASGNFWPGPDRTGVRHHPGSFLGCRTDSCHGHLWPGIWSVSGRSPFDWRPCACKPRRVRQLFSPGNGGFRRLPAERQIPPGIIRSRPTCPRTARGRTQLPGAAQGPCVRWLCCFDRNQSGAMSAFLTAGAFIYIDTSGVPTQSFVLYYRFTGLW